MWWESGLRLPGPQGLVKRALDAVSAGRSVALVFPKAAVASGLANEAVSEVSQLAAAYPMTVAPDRSVCGFLLGEMGLPIPSGGPSEAWLQIANSPESSGIVRAVCSWESDVVEVLQHWPRAVHARVGATGTRPLSFIIGIAYGDVEDEVLERIDALHVDVMWWWGCLGHLDTLVYLAHEAPQSLGRLERETIAEVCAWDLGLSLRLAHEWDGDPSRMPEILDACLDGGSEVAKGYPEDRAGAASDRPPADLRPAWSAGALDLWDGYVRGSASKSEATRSVWRAQCAVLLPRLDDHRRRLQKEFWRRASKATLLGLLNHGSLPGSREYLNDLPSIDDVVLEFGDMHFACRARLVTLDEATRRELHALRQIRNALAHGQPAPDQYFHDVRHLLM